MVYLTILMLKVSFQFQPFRPLIVDAEEKKNQDEETCYQMEKSFIPGTNPNNESFITRSGDNCSRYCKFSSTCWAFSIHIFTFECTLLYLPRAIHYRLPPLSHITVLNTYSVVGRKECFQDEIYKSNRLSLKLVLNDEVKRVVIMNTETVKCLHAIDSGQYNGTIPIIWKTCDAKSLTDWTVKGFMGSIQTLLVNTLVQQKQDYAVRISPSDNQSWCLDLTRNATSTINLVLTHCRDIPSVNDSQVIYLRKGVYSADKIVSLSSYIPNDDNKLSFGILKLPTNHTLDHIAFMKPQKKEYACYNYSLRTKNSFIKLSDIRKPFILPEDKVTILCRRGFGVKQLNYSSIQEHTCQKNVMTYPCTKIKLERGEKEIYSNYVIVTLILTIAFILQTLLMIKIIFKKRVSTIDTPQKDADGEKGDEAQKTTVID